MYERITNYMIKTQLYHEMFFGINPETVTFLKKILPDQLKVTAQFQGIYRVDHFSTNNYFLK